MEGTQGADYKSSNRFFWISITVAAIAALIVFATLLTLTSSKEYAVGVNEDTQQTIRDDQPTADTEKDSAGYDAIQQKAMAYAQKKGWVENRDYVMPQPIAIRKELADIWRLPEDSGQVLGDNKSTVRMILFSNFSCAYCHKFHAESMGKLEKLAREGKIFIEFYHLPFSSDDSSMRAALAAFAAGKQGKFWEYSDALFTNTNSPETADLNMDFLQSLATHYGLDENQFVADMNSEQARKFVDKQRQLASDLGISSTPAILINGTYIPGAVPTQVFLNTIEMEAYLTYGYESYLDPK